MVKRGKEHIVYLFLFLAVSMFLFLSYVSDDTVRSYSSSTVFTGNSIFDVFSFLSPTGDAGELGVLDAPSDYVAYYPFDGDVTDSSGNGLDCSLVGGSYVSGHDGQALSFNGGDYVDCSNSAFFNPSGFYSISLWFNTDSVSGWKALLTKDLEMQYWLGLNNGKASFLVSDNGVSYSTIAGDTTVSVGNWYHYAVVYDGSDVRIYLNGVLDNTPSSYSSGIYSSDVSRLLIGYSDKWSGNDFLGMIDDVKIYDRALSASEVADLAGVDSGCSDGETQLCSNQNGVCSGSFETCSGGDWPGCDYSGISGYEATEVSCSDAEDNDCDSLVDCDDGDDDGFDYNSDCNDSNYWVNPNATEYCGNGIDDDCSGEENNGCVDVYIDVLGFDGNTTNLSKLSMPALGSVSDVILEKTSFGRMEFLDALSFYKSLNLSDVVLLGDKEVSVDPSRYDEFDKIVNITFYNVGFIEPKLLRNGVLCSDHCMNISYSNGRYSFIVDGFSSYSVVEGYISPSDDGSGTSGSGGGSPGGGGAIPPPPDDTETEPVQLSPVVEEPALVLDAPSSLDVEILDKKDFSVSVTNNQDVDVDLVVSLAIPGGWKYSGKNSVSLPSHSSKALSFTLLTNHESMDNPSIVVNVGEYDALIDVDLSYPDILSKPVPVFGAYHDSLDVYTIMKNSDYNGRVDVELNLNKDLKTYVFEYLRPKFKHDDDIFVYKSSFDISHLPSDDYYLLARYYYKGELLATNIVPVAISNDADLDVGNQLTGQAIFGNNGYFGRNYNVYVYVFVFILCLLFFYFHFRNVIYKKRKR